MTTPPDAPSPEFQLDFLQQLQRLLDEGSFVATYKYALLHAIADLGVLHGQDSGAELTLTTRQIAERFAELYWQQGVPFPAGDRLEVLNQNTGRQAAVVNAVHETRAQYGGRLSAAKRTAEVWEPLVKRVEETVCRMPLWRLQTVGQEQIEFLYANTGRGQSITLRPGVAYCFRVFYPLITDMVEGAWSHFIRRYNHQILGTTTDLRTFLFGADRTALSRLQPILHDVQQGTCLYCKAAFASRAICVDHFVPWRRYPVDLGHNFVLAHDTCNSRKGDRLAAEVHLERWRDRNVEHGQELAERFTAAGFQQDWPSSLRVTRWAYAQVERSRGQVWVEGSRLEALSTGWEAVLPAA